VPRTAAPGNPWIWRVNCPDPTSRVDLALLANGFHIAYILPELYGPTREQWDGFYRYLTEKHSFARKPALEGSGAAAGEADAWAEANPEPNLFAFEKRLRMPNL
jgi:sialidase-1